MSTAKAWSFVVVVSLCAAVQEMGGFKRCYTKWLGRPPAIGAGAPTSLVQRATGLVPSLSCVIEEEKRTFEETVFGPTTGACAQAAADTAASNAVVRAAGCVTSGPGRGAPFSERAHVKVIGKVVMLCESRPSAQNLQSFMVKLASGALVLVTHDVRRAQRVAGLKVGEDVEVAGDFTRGCNGDEITNTHREPGAGASGWVLYGGRVYD